MWLRGSIVFAILASLWGCATHRGVYHPVGKGETLWRIAYTYEADIQDIAEANDIRDPTKINAGERIFIPGAKSLRKVTPYVPGREEEKPKEVIVEKGRRFDWPIRGEIISAYGMRGDVMHHGIDIKAQRNTPVRASSDGEVVYSGNGMRGYGNVVIIRHGDDFFTIYAHNEKNLAKTGDKITKGDAVSLVGDSGNAETCHLHFEIRQGKKTRNPIFFLP